MTAAKLTSFAVAMLAAVAMVVAPVAPGYAAGAGDRSAVVAKSDVSASRPSAKEVRRAVAVHAERGNAAILTKAQMDGLSRSNPKLHAKLMAAYRSHTVPTLTATEKKSLQRMTAKNLEQYKAGSPEVVVATSAAIGAGGWFVIAFIAIIALLMFVEIFHPGLVRLIVARLFAGAR